MSTSTDLDVIDELLDGDAACQVRLPGDPNCGRLAAWRMAFDCPLCRYAPTGNVCQAHRDEFYAGDGWCGWCGTHVTIRWEYPI
jgi:hypothetical protein